MRPDDLPPLGLQVENAATDLIRLAAPTGRLEVGAELVRPVLGLMVSSYLGLSELDRPAQQGWGRDLYQDLFLNPAGVSSLRRRAARAQNAFDAHLTALIDRGPDGTDVLDRLLAQDPRLDDAELRANLLGIAIGWLWHAPKAAMLALDGLLDRPYAFAAARRAAHDRDHEALRRLLWEVLRFRAVQTGVARMTTREVTLAAGTARARTIPARTVVFAGLHSAMWDETAIPEPGSFDPSRPTGQYLIFGHGMHRCFGEAATAVQLPALLAPLLRQPGLRRAPGRAGRLRWSGAFPMTLQLRLPGA
jgi:cytochrome P450